MTELAGVELRRVSVVVAGRHHDVAIDARARLGDLLDELGLPPGAEVIAPDGARPNRSATLAASGVADGAVLVAVDGEHAPARVRGGAARSAAHAPGSRAVDHPAGSVSPPTQSMPAAPAADQLSALPPGVRAGLPAGVAVAVVALAVTVGLLSRPPAVLPGAVLLAAALVLGWVAHGVRARLVAALAGATGGALLVLAVVADLPAGAVHLTVAGAALGAALSAVLGRDPRSARAGRTVVTSGLVTALAAVLALVAALPAGVLAVGAVGAAALLARMLPDLVVRLDDSATVDLDRLATTAWSPRPRTVRARWWRLLRADVDAQVRDAAAHQRVVLAGTFAAVVFATATLTVAAPGSVTATIVLLGVAGLGLGLVARRYRGQVDRWLVRLAGFAAVVGAGLLLASMVSAGTGLALAVGGVLVVLGLVLLAPVVGRGWTSLPLSRLADVAEALCVAAALPLAVWAAGLVPWIRSLVG